jgi:hypothetical protein
MDSFPKNPDPATSAEASAHASLCAAPAAAGSAAAAPLPPPKPGAAGAGSVVFNVDDAPTEQPRLDRQDTLRSAKSGFSTPRTARHPSGSGGGGWGGGSAGLRRGPTALAAARPRVTQARRRRRATGQWTSGPPLAAADGTLTAHPAASLRRQNAAVAWQTTPGLTRQNTFRTAKSDCAKSEGARSEAGAGSGGSDGSDGSGGGGRSPQARRRTAHSPEAQARFAEARAGPPGVGGISIGRPGSGGGLSSGPARLPPPAPREADGADGADGALLELVRDNNTVRLGCRSSFF